MDAWNRDQGASHTSVVTTSIAYVGAKGPSISTAGNPSFPGTRMDTWSRCQGTNCISVLSTSMAYVGVREPSIFDCVSPSSQAPEWTPRSGPRVRTVFSAVATLYRYRVPGSQGTKHRQLLFPCLFSATKFTPGNRCQGTIVFPWLPLVSHT